jgi:hypothetical protein
MIEEIVGTMTPYIVNGRKLYDEADVKKALAKMLWVVSHPSSAPAEPSELNEYSEVTC